MTAKTPLPDESASPDEAPPLYEASTSSNTPDSPTSTSSSSTTLTQNWRKSLQTFFLASASRAEVQRIVLELIGDIVKEPNSSPFDAKIAQTMLRNCAQACKNQGIPFSSLLQDWYYAGHTALYWAIVNKPKRGLGSTSLVEDWESLLTAMLKFAAPLKSATLEEARQACLIVSDDELFQKLRLASQDLAGLSETARILLGENRPDQVKVLDVSRDGKVFVVDLQLMQFQKRMKISKAISVEFIAKSRMWCLQFRVSDQEMASQDGIPARGAWYASLSLLRGSPATFIDSRLIIVKANLGCPPPGDRSLLDVYSDASTSPETAFKNFLKKTPQGEEPEMVFHSMRIKSAYELKPPEFTRHYVQDTINVSLGHESWVSVLQYSGSEFVGSDDTLRARFEAKLDKPEKECIIC